MNHQNFSPIRTQTISSALAHVRQRIAGLTDSPGLDSQVLLAFVCRRDRAWVLAHPEYELSSEETLKMAEALARIYAGVPLPYVIGEWEFFGMLFKVTPHVLIPRPETELLVETAINWLQNNPQRTRIAEVGTGSGCIAISIAANVPGAKITATDISPEAIAVAEKNAALHQVCDQTQLLENDLLSGIPGPFDLICANLPYIPSAALRQLPVYLREPTLALDGGENGLNIIGRLLEQTADKLAKGGLALLEIEAGQANEAKVLAARCFPNAVIHTKLDLAGHHRLLIIENQ
ncbi:MAG: peptide chain release factor N(5)-glutamine methyltransferase [Anaerolineales bacterium]